MRVWLKPLNIFCVLCCWTWFFALQINATTSAQLQNGTGVNGWLINSTWASTFPMWVTFPDIDGTVWTQIEMHSLFNVIVAILHWWGCQNLSNLCHPEISGAQARIGPKNGTGANEGGPDRSWSDGHPHQLVQDHVQSWLCKIYFPFLLVNVQMIWLRMDLYRL